LGAHVAPLGIEFYTGKQFPAEYRDNLAIFAEHGSWNRSKKSGYRVMMVKTDGNKALSYTPFIEGWLDVAADLAWGRPVDIELMPDGSMLISDDFANVIYRVVYQG
jgi:glucose/arabinose dehydrogenase